MSSLRSIDLSLVDEVFHGDSGKGWVLDFSIRIVGDSSAKLKVALAAFNKEASLTPAQRARRDVLKSMNLTEDAIKAMPPEQRKVTEQKIAAEVSRRLQLGEGGKDQTASTGADTAAPLALSV